MTISKVFRLALLASAAMAAMAVPASADPISTAIVTSIGFTAGTSAFATAVSVTNAIIGAGLSFGANLLTSALSGKPQGLSGSAQQTEIGAASPRRILFGRGLTGGSLVYERGEGNNNNKLHRIYRICDWECQSLDAVWVNGDRRNLTTATIVGTEDARYIVNGTDSTIVVKWFKGSASQSADSELVAVSAGDTAGASFGEWTTDHRMDGICYVSVRLEYQKVSMPIIPQLAFEVSGAKLYDWRLDSTNGGSGSHRWNNPSTWAFSENPAVQDYNFRRGFYRGSYRALGMGTAATDLLLDLYTAAANICDESVTEGDGSTEKRYICGVLVNDDAEWRVACDAFRLAMAGDVVERAGAFGPIAGAAYSSVATITDDDVLTGFGWSYAAKAPRSDLYNAVACQFLNPNLQWQGDALTALTNSTWETNDNSERLTKDLDLLMVSKPYQARRIATIVHNQSRRQKRGSAVVGPSFAALEPGDWITRTFNRDGFDTITAKVTAIEEVAALQFRVSWAECHADDYNGPAGTITLPGTPTITGPNRAPARPTALTASNNKPYVVDLEWSFADENDADMMQVWEASSNAFGSAVKIATVRATKYSRQLAAAGTYYYWIIAQDEAGRASPKYPAGSSAGVAGTATEINASASSQFPFYLPWGAVQDGLFSDGGLASVNLPASFSGSAYFDLDGTARLMPTGVEYNITATYSAGGSSDFAKIQGTFPRGKGIAWPEFFTLVRSTTGFDYGLRIDSNGMIWERRATKAVGAGSAAWSESAITAFINDADQHPLYDGAYASTDIHVYKATLLKGIRRIRVPDTVTVAGTPTPVTGARFWLWGAAGQRGYNGAKGGPGGYVKFSHTLVAGEILSLLVGAYDGDGFGGSSFPAGDTSGNYSYVRYLNQGGGGSFVARGKFERGNLLGVAGGGGSGSDNKGGPGGSTNGGGNGSSSSQLDRCVGKSEHVTGLSAAGTGSGGGGYVGGGLITAINRSPGKGGTNFIIGTATSTTNSASSEDVNGSQTTDTPPGTAEAPYVSDGTYDMGRADVGKASATTNKSGPGMIAIQWLT